MSFIQAIILGIVQGLTEFLPISSSAHLVLVPFLFKWEMSPEIVFIFDVLVQLGTLVAVIVFFWKELSAIIQSFLSGIWHRQPFKDPQARLGWYLILATIPASVVGLLIKDMVESAFQSAIATALFLLLTSILLVGAEKIGKRNRTISDTTSMDALWIGFFQVISLFPGVSRSGSTITGGMTRNLDRPSAARISFLMSVPVMLAAGMVELVDVFRSPDTTAYLPQIVAGFVTAAVVGYFSIRWFLGYLARRSLYPFALYCTAVSVLILLLHIIRG